MTRAVPRLGFLCSLLVSLSLGACAGETREDAASATQEVNGTVPRRAAPNGLRLRVLAGNISSGNLQSYDPGEGIRILQGLAPDVAILQEMNYGANMEGDYKTFVTEAFDSSFSFYAEPDVQIPNAIVSRYPIVASGAWDDPRVNNRSFVWARIDVPGDKDLWAVSLHLLTTGTENRQVEATALVAKLRSVVPESDYLVIGGDLNTGSRTEGCLRTLGELTRTTAPWPVDSRGNGNTSARRSKPLDWLIADPDLDPLNVPVVIGGAQFANGLVFDSRVFPSLEDVAPTRKSDSAASNMQHMAVVRDFALPAIIAPSKPLPADPVPSDEAPAQP